MSRWAVLVLALGAAILSTGCASKHDDATPPAQQFASKDVLLNPGTCYSCHPNHYTEWSGSMHAYASDDPLFRALNRRMQRETNGALGTFCLQCHAPMAVALGRVKDGSELDSMPALKGVTCYFCHTAVGVHGNANNALDLASDAVFGGAIQDPVAQDRPHDAAYVTWLDGTKDNSPATCGACHDIVTPAGAPIERTFDEWKKSRFGTGERTKTSCESCHVPPHDGRAAEVAGAPPRTQHDHTMAGVDLALTDFPGRDVQRAAVQKLLDDAVDARLCVTPTATGATIDVALSNHKAGHAFPSGSNQDRRAWIELVAYAGTDVVLSTGQVPADSAVEKLTDPYLFVLRDHLFDAQGAETQLFWQAAGYKSAQLPPEVTSNAADPRYDNSVHKTYDLNKAPDHITMQVNIRPVDYDLIDELVRSGDLDPSTLSPLATITLAHTKLDWSAASGGCVGP